MKVTYWNPSIAGGCETYKDLLAYEKLLCVSASTTMEVNDEAQSVEILKLLHDETHSSFHMHTHLANGIYFYRSADYSNPAAAKSEGGSFYDAIAHGLPDSIDVVVAAMTAGLNAAGCLGSEIGVVVVVKGQEFSAEGVERFISENPDCESIHDMIN